MNQVRKTELLVEAGSDRAHLASAHVAGTGNGGERGVAGNLIWNVVGESLPVLAAVVAIPILLRRLGADRFGVLTLSWMFAGYFGMFDFGLGRALTKLMAQELSLHHGAKAAALFWTALAMTLAFGVLAAVALAALAPWLTGSALKIPPALRRESLLGFYAIALGLPMLVSASALRAALTAADRFDLLNLIRTPIGIMSFFAPVLLLPFTRSLGWLIAVLMLNRAFSWAIYFFAIIRTLPATGSRPRFERSLMRPLLGFGAWITVSNIVTPLMIYLDRFLIGAMVSIGALTLYAIPMELIGKSVVLPAAVAGVMYPAFARSFAAAPDRLGIWFARSLKLIALILFPPCLVIVALAPQIMSIWIERRFALQSSTVLRILTVGAFITGLSWIPLTLLHAAHRPDLTAKLHIVDFPFYALLLWILIREYGLAGAALAWSGRLLVENVVLFAMARRLLPDPRRQTFNSYPALGLAAIVIASGAFIPDGPPKTAFLCAVLLSFGAVAWRYILDGAERAQVVGILRLRMALHPDAGTVE